MVGSSVRFIAWEVALSRMPQFCQARVESNERDEQDAVAWTNDLEIACAIGSDESDEASLDFASLCDNYWPMLHRFVRSRGYDFHESQDLTQSFFLHLLQRRVFSRIDRTKGSLSSFLFAALRNFLCNEWDSRKAWKRGGRTTVVSLSDPLGSFLNIHAVADATVRTGNLDRPWAVALANRVIKRLREEYSAKGKAELFSKLEPALFSETDAFSHDETSVYPRMTEVSARVALHRLRRRFGDLLRNEIARSSDGMGIDQEVRHLFAALY